MFGGLVKCPMVIRTPNGAGNQLTAQHSQSFDGWFAHTPGLKVVSPATPADAKGLLKSAIRDDDPVLVIENLAIYKEKGQVPDDPEFLTPIGEANVAREGSDLTIVSHSFATVRALHVAERLAAEHGAQVEVVDLRSLRPLDMETVANSVAKTNRALCVEEGWPTYGVTAEIAARVQHACFDDLDAPVTRVGMAEVPMPYAKNARIARHSETVAMAPGWMHAPIGTRTRGRDHRAMATLSIVLVIVGAALMVAEAHVPSHGALGAGAAAALTAGVVLLLSSAGAPGVAVVAAGAAVALAGLALAWLLLVKSLGARRLAVRSGPRALVGRVAIVRSVPAPVGRVQLDGALWRARLWEFEEGVPVAEGSAVVVESLDGLTLTVRPAEEWEVQ